MTLDLERVIFPVAGLLALAGCADAPAVGSEAQALYAAEAPASYAHYVALGDSFASGVGATGSQGGCGQSSKAWPQLLHDSLQIADPLIFAACSGATTQDIMGEGPLTTRWMTQTGPQIAQLPAADQLDTSLITVQIGGNDIKLDENIKKCTAGAQGSSGSSSASLSALSPDCLDLERLLDNSAAVVRDSLGPSLDYTFRALRAAAPNATIVAVGYPHLVDATTACDSTFFGKLINASNRQKMNDVADAINKQVATSAANAGILSVTNELVSAFAGHEGCSSTEWIVSGNNIFADKNSGLLHPNDTGYEVIAQTVSAALQSVPTRIGTIDTEPEPPPSDPLPTPEE